MKKLYIFVTPSIVNIGGAEIYVRNKYLYLKNHGWNSYIISSRKGEIFVDGLSDCKDYILEDLQVEPYLFSARKRTKIINRIISFLPDLKGYDEIIVESHSINISLWGELLAQKISGKHIAYILQENDTISIKKYKYLKFKLDRKELAGINKNSLRNIFKPFEYIPEDKTYFLLASCNNSVEDIESKWGRNIPKADFSIGSIGRIEKPYLQTVIYDIQEFATNHPDYTYNLFFIGGETDGRTITNQIYETFKKFKNINVFVTGFIFPIPLSLLKTIDVFMSSAGSVRVSCNVGKPTISYDANDLQPIGLKDYTTNNTLYRDDEEIIKGSVWLERILINKEFEPKPFVFNQIMPSFSEHFKFLSDSTKGNGYYDIASWPLSKKDLVKSLIIRLNCRNLIFKIAKLRNHY